MCTFVYTSVALFSRPRKRLLDIARLGFPMAEPLSERDLQKQLPGGYGGRASRAGEGRVGAANFNEKSEEIDGPQQTLSKGRITSWASGYFYIRTRWMMLLA